jgi:hypothetical protein
MEDAVKGGTGSIGRASGGLAAFPTSTRSRECAMLGPPKPHYLDQPIAVSLEDLAPTDNFYGHLETKLDFSSGSGSVSSTPSGVGRASTRSGQRQQPHIVPEEQVAQGRELALTPVERGERRGQVRGSGGQRHRGDAVT